MNVDCFYCLRYLLLFIIFFNMILGFSLVGAALWTFLHGARMGEIIGGTEGFNYILFFLMVLGAVKVLVGLIGCCSVTKKNSKLLTLFFSMVLIVFLGQIGAGIWLYLDEDKMTKTAEDSLTTFIKEEYGSVKCDGKTRALDVLQQRLECCGSHGPSDWKTADYNIANETMIKGEYLVPSSCCTSNSTDTCDVARRIVNDVYDESIYDEGCIHKILTQIFAYGAEILGVIGGIILVELFVMISTIILCRSKNVRYSL